jgi:hypothetical protein
MNLSKRAKLSAGALVLAGLVAAGGAAFTDTGVTDQAGAAQFVGGTVTQSVTGATLANIAYGFADPSGGGDGVSANTEVDQVTLTFDDANTNGLIPTLGFTATNDTSAGWSCTPITAITFVSVCNPASGTIVGLTAIAVTVPSTNTTNNTVIANPAP